MKIGCDGEHTQLGGQLRNTVRNTALQVIDKYMVNPELGLENIRVKIGCGGGGDEKICWSIIISQNNIPKNPNMKIQLSSEHLLFHANALTLRCVIFRGLRYDEKNIGVISLCKIFCHNNLIEN